MVTVNDLILAFEHYRTLSDVRAKQHARALINAEILPVSRGRSISHIGTQHVVPMLLASILQPKQKDIANTVSDYLLLSCEGFKRKKDYLYQDFFYRRKLIFADLMKEIFDRIKVSPKNPSKLSSADKQLLNSTFTIGNNFEYAEIYLPHVQELDSVYLVFEKMPPEEHKNSSIKVTELRPAIDRKSTFTGALLFNLLYEIWGDPEFEEWASTDE